MKFQNILVTTDFSSAAENAFSFAYDLAKRDNAQITLLSVLEFHLDPGTAPWGVPSDGMVPELREQLLKNAQKLIGELAAKHFSDLPVKTEVFFGNHAAAQEITSYAGAQGIDLIVMARHGRGAIASLLLGSVISKVIKLAACPVFVAPPPKAAQ